MQGLAYADVIPYLLKVIPEIRQLYERRVKALYAENNPHVIYGSIFFEHIESLEKQLEGPNREAAESSLRKAFLLLEELSSSEDFQTRCLAETSVLESLLGEKGGHKRYERFMGSETRKLARDVLA